MGAHEVLEVRKSLLKLYSDRTLQYAGFSIGSFLALLSEVIGSDRFPSLFGAKPAALFWALALGTIAFGLLLVVRSIFWSRMTYVTVKKPFPKEITPEPIDFFSEMYEWHIGSMKKNYSLLTRIGNSSIVWSLLVALVFFIVGFLIGQFF